MTRRPNKAILRITTLDNQMVASSLFATSLIYKDGISTVVIVKGLFHTISAA